VSHSMGTVIAYDLLRRVPECPAVDALVTIGSPLGLDEIQDRFRPEWTRADGFPGEKVRSGRWVNVFDRLDPVAGFDPSLANDYRRGGTAIITDIHEPNHGAWRHDIAKYLAGPRLRAALRELLES
jgi:pimeloyl-ACP methyl ester carboxylesterase